MRIKGLIRKKALRTAVAHSKDYASVCCYGQTSAELMATQDSSMTTLSEPAPAALRLLRPAPIPTGSGQPRSCRDAGRRKVSSPRPSAHPDETCNEQCGSVLNQGVLLVFVCLFACRFYHHACFLSFLVLKISPSSAPSNPTDEF